MEESLTLRQFCYRPEEMESLNNWLFQQIQPALYARIIDACTPNGDWARLFVQAGLPVHLNSINEEDRRSLQTQFQGVEEIRGVHQIDFGLPYLEEGYQQFRARFRTVVALSFRDPVFYKKQTLQKMGLLLKEEGLLIVLLPSQTAVFPGIPYDLDEVRRIDFRPLQRLFEGFDLLTVDYFELLNDGGYSPAPAPGLYLIVIARKPKSPPAAQPTDEPQ